MKFRVTMHRIEEISFDIEADSEADAVERFLAEGDEVHATTIDSKVVNVEEMDA